MVLFQHFFSFLFFNNRRFFKEEPVSYFINNPFVNKNFGKFSEKTILTFIFSFFDDNHPQTPPLQE